MAGEVLVLAACGCWAFAGGWLSVVDWKTRQLPTRVIWSAAGSVWAFFSAASLVERSGAGLLGSVLGGLIGGGVPAVVYFVNSSWMGFGDVRLSTLNGLLCGWWGWQFAFWGLGAGFAAAFPMALWTLLREGARVAKPLGPYLVLGSATAVILATYGRGLIPF